jgi:hypothetical protein
MILLNGLGTLIIWPELSIIVFSLLAIAGTEKITTQSKNTKKLIRPAAAVVGVIFFITGIVIYCAQY